MDKSSSKRRIEQIGGLPSLPEIAIQLQQIVNDPTTSAIDAANLINRDIGLTSRVLRLANSAFYGIPRTITTVQNAVVILGLKVINTLVLSVSIVQMFPSDKGQQAFDRRKFWQHCLSCGVLAKLLSLRIRKFGMLDPEECFCAGLLHDLGRVVMDQYLHEEFCQVLKICSEQKISMVQAELQVFGFDHTDVGEWLTEKWDLPQEIRIPIFAHHDPEKTPFAKEISQLVAAADDFCYQLGFVVPGFETNPFKPELSPASKLGLSEDELNAIRVAAPLEIEKLQAAFIFS